MCVYVTWHWAVTVGGVLLRWPPARRTRVSALQWSGQCSFCKEWNTLKEFTPPPAQGGGRPSGNSGGRKSWQAGSAQEASRFVRLEDVATQAGHRIPLASKELVRVSCRVASTVVCWFLQPTHYMVLVMTLCVPMWCYQSRVLGGGLTQSSVVLVGGTPGVGKSTLMMQLAAMLARGTDDTPGLSVAYVSGEESSQQLKQRAARLGVSSDDVSVLNETDLGSIIAQLQPDGAGRLPYQVAVIDSVQTMYDQPTGLNLPRLS